jgi:apolipoprotein N-acyltransferase
MRVYGLWILGSPLGYPFASIVLPISHYSNVLLMVSIVGIVVMQAFIIFSSLLSAALLARGRWGWLLFVLVFFVSLLFYHPRPLHQAPDWCTSIVAVTPYSAQGSCARDCADDIRSMLVKYAEDQHISMIIMPESSYPFVLDAETAASWCDVLPSRDTALIVGAQREEKNSLYTTMFFVSDRLIIDYYDKKLLVPCVEYIPTLWQPLQCMKTLFLKGITSLCCGNSQNKRWCLVPGFIVQPCICSDLFFSLNTQNYCDESTLLCIVNDSWFMYAYPKDLMVLFARMHAAVCRQDVIYVSYAHAFFISQDGYLHFLKS